MAYEQLVSVPSSATSGQIPKADGNGSFTWENPVEGGGASSATVTIATTDWSNGSATVNVTGVSSSSIVMCSPDAASAQTIADCKVFCTGQGSGTLTFTAATTPSASITYNVAIMSNTGGGGGGSTSRDVIFIDYDGTEICSYSAAEANALSALPDNPSHEGLVSQGWNWTLQQIKTQLAENIDAPILVGQVYGTVSGATEIDIDLPDALLNSYLSVASESGASYTIDWGDGTVETKNPGTSDFLNHSHQYASSGEYTIKVATNGTNKIAFSKDAGFYTILNGNTASVGIANTPYACCVKNVRFGDNVYFESFSGQGYGTGCCSCYSIQTVTIPSTASGRPYDLFFSCRLIKTVIVPQSITEFRVGAFSYIYSNAKISLPFSLTTLGASAFYESYVAQSVIPKNIVSFGASAFLNCSTLPQAIKTPSNTTIGANCFSNSAIKSAFIASNSSIADNAFANCSRLKDATIQDGVTISGNYNFAKCSSLKTVNCSSELISSNMFYNDVNLTQVTLSNTTTINGQAFSACISLHSITIPNTVTNIAIGVFVNCRAMSECHMLSTTPPELAGQIFSNCPSNVYVPYSSDHSVLTAYKEATNWSTYADRIFEEPQS